MRLSAEVTVFVDGAGARLPRAPVGLFLGQTPSGGGSSRSTPTACAANPTWGRSPSRPAPPRDGSDAAGHDRAGDPFRVARDLAQHPRR